MNLNDDVYPFSGKQVEQSYIQFFFISPGFVEVIKVIRYEKIGKLQGKPIYNLGFGDLDIADAKINDTISTKNGDQYKVLNTVLSSIPHFFEVCKDSIIMVQGSDSLPSYIANCKLDCRKGCNENCKNAHRRIRVYKGYINKNYEFLRKKYNGSIRALSN